MIAAFPLAFVTEWIDRKVSARVQRRKGPPFLQPLYDFIKLLCKEDLRVNYPGSNIFPIFLIVSTGIVLYLFLFLPFPTKLISFKDDLIFVVFFYSFVPMLLALLAYVIPSIYSNIGAERVVKLFIAFEIPFLLSIASVIAVVKSATLQDIMSFKVPLALILPLAFTIYVISMLADSEITPFDIPEAHTEVAGGWTCELSGRCLALAQLLKNLRLLFLASLGAVLFMGPCTSFMSLLPRTLLLIFIASLIRNMGGRIREDQAITLFWKEIIPLAIIQLIIALSGG